MNTLTPSQAAAMANGVYAVRTRSIAELHRIGTPLGCEGLFSVADDARIRGRSGAIAKLLSGFGYIAEGEGAFKGEVAIVTRGTYATSGYDWASNANVGIQTGPGGRFVHAGFNEVWKSYRETLDAFLQNRNPSQVHCVGHSLGGALAFLNADYLTSRKVAAVAVYTFGAPRAGLSWFAGDLTRKVGVDRIFRTSHMSDPVPMVPMFPFHHAPTTAPGYALSRGAGGSFISVSAHGMVSSYVPATVGKSWDALRQPESEVSDYEIDHWLQATAYGSAVPPFSAEALRMIGRVLRWILKKTGMLIAASVGVGLTVTFTLLDHMAWMVARGAELSLELAKTGMALVRAIFRFLGYVAGTVVELTAKFLRWLLDLLFTKLGGLASRALSAL